MTVRILVGDALEHLRTLEPESVQCCVTSPPYWGLRDYGTATWKGGDPACSHRVGGQVQDSKAPGAITTGQRPGVDASVCRTCGAQRIDAQIGLERTPDEYVAKMVEVFSAVRGALKKDGTLWLNVGDSYNAYNGNRGGSPGISDVAREARPVLPAGHGLTCKDLKPKDLVGIPWLLAFALRTAGWYLRADIIWSKPNPMPESVTDRPTKAHEYVFLLAKSERYFYDADAIAEPFADARMGNPGTYRRTPQSSKGANNDRADTGFLNNGAGWNADGASATRNRRSVWQISTQPFPESHFATMPPKLAETCIRAGCPEGGTVLDPFGGAGTTGLVADRLGRDAILCELNPEYARMAERRIQGDAGMFASVDVA